MVRAARIPADAIELDRTRITPAALSAALICASGRGRPPRGEPLARLCARICSGERFIAALAGARVEANGEAVRIMREPGEQRRSGLEPVPLPLGRAVVWDGRFELLAHVAGLRAAPLAGLAARLSTAERVRLRVLPPAARAALPALVDSKGEVSLPAPFGAGPATAVCLVQTRLEAALGLVPDEGALFRDAASRPHGADPAPILS